MAQAISGVISGAEPEIWNAHLDELLNTFIDEYASAGGPRLDLHELRLQVLLIVALSGIAFAMLAPVGITREINNLESVSSYQDHIFQQHDNARTQLHMLTKTLNVWQQYKLGDLIRAL